MPGRPLVHRTARAIGDRRDEGPLGLAPPGRRERDVCLDDVTGAQLGKRREPLRVWDRRDRQRPRGAERNRDDRDARREPAPIAQLELDAIALAEQADDRRAEEEPAVKALGRGDREGGRAPGDPQRQAPVRRPAARLLGRHREQRHLGRRHGGAADGVHRVDERERVGVGAALRDPGGETRRIEGARALRLPRGIRIHGCRDRLDLVVECRDELERSLRWSTVAGTDAPVSGCFYMDARLALDPQLDEQAGDGRVPRVEELAPRLDREARDVIRRDAAAETGPRLDETDVHAASDQGDGSRNPRHAAADDQDIVPRVAAIGAVSHAGYGGGSAGWPRSRRSF